jgi:uncharacterized protein YkwD
LNVRLRLFVIPLLAALFLAPAGVAATRLDTALVREVNAVRAEHGLKPLAISTKLSTPAAQHTREMGMNGYFEHDSLNATPFWQRIERWYPSRGCRLWAVGENLLWSDENLTASDAVDMWMQSPDHRANLLSPRWHDIGISAIHFDAAPGDYDGESVTIVTADFGLRR